MSSRQRLLAALAHYEGIPTLAHSVRYEVITPARQLAYIVVPAEDAQILVLVTQISTR
jgi:hypothetical protein